MKKIIISQRFEKIGKFKELRDNLDTRLTNLILKLGFLPILLPSNSRNVLRYINEISPSGIILSGGGNPKKKDERYNSEKILLNFASKKKIPLLHKEINKAINLIYKTIKCNACQQNVYNPMLQSKKVFKIVCLLSKFN